MRACWLRGPKRGRLVRHHQTQIAGQIAHPYPRHEAKGVSDAADRSKDAEDAKGYWREMAKENPVRLILGMIRRGSIRPLNTDQFYLDPTAGSVADARGKILDVSSPGSSYLAFPRLVVPKGPLTGLDLCIAANGNQGHLPVHKLVVEYWDYRRSRKEKTIDCPECAERPGEYRVHLEEPISAEPVGIYMMIRGTPNRITFNALSSNTMLSTDWVPTL